MADRRDEDLPRTVFDRGLQQERTALAWDRTAVALMVAGVLFIRGGAAPYGDLRHLPGFAAVAAGVWVLWHAYRDYNRRHELLRREESITQPGLVRLVALVTLVLSVASLVLLATSWGVQPSVAWR